MKNINTIMSTIPVIIEINSAMKKICIIVNDVRFMIIISLINMKVIVIGVILNVVMDGMLLVIMIS